jgi:xylulokinase
MYIGIDLGSTNIKAALYDSDFQLVSRLSKPVEYFRENGVVEFDAKAYCDDLVELLRLLTKDVSVRQIAFTGQAESLVVVGKDGKPMMNAISWMDERSTEQCKVLEKQFPPEIVRSVTGQQAVLPTWPATKILWLKENRPEIYEGAESFMLLKDYVVYYLTGRKIADMSIATFSLYFDIYRKCYWRQMLEAIGIDESRLPPLAEPCSVAGTLLPELGLGEVEVNIGTLDHFAGMIGTGNCTPGGITLSTGTVMALSVMAETVNKESEIAVHYGFLPDTYVLLPVAESGGVSLEWFRRTCMEGVDYGKLNEVLESRDGKDELLFLPYLVGVSAPEFDADATGVFWGLRQEHDKFHMARAVMEGVAFMLRKNCEALNRSGTTCKAIMATGGGAKSPTWCQMQADITGLAVNVPKEQEAACLGAAMIAGVSDGRFAGYAEAAEHCVSMAACYTPQPTEFLEKKYRKFCALYKAALEIARM